MIQVISICVFIVSGTAFAFGDYDDVSGQGARVGAGASARARANASAGTGTKGLLRLCLSTAAATARVELDELILDVRFALLTITGACEYLRVSCGIGGANLIRIDFIFTQVLLQFSK